MEPLGKHGGVPFGGQDADLIRRPTPELTGQVLGTPHDVRRVMGEVGNRGNFHPFDELAHEPVTVRIDVGHHLPHPRFIPKIGPAILLPSPG
jgi:hypothetical protein